MTPLLRWLVCRVRGHNWDWMGHCNRCCKSKLTPAGEAYRKQLETGMAEAFRIRPRYLSPEEIKEMAALKRGCDEQKAQMRVWYQGKRLKP